MTRLAYSFNSLIGRNAPTPSCGSSAACQHGSDVAVGSRLSIRALSSMELALFHRYSHAGGACGRCVRSRFCATCQHVSG